jgi:flagellar biosynthetic protein FliR
VSLLELTGGDITSLLGHLWWPFLRISALLWTMPMFGDTLTAVKVRVLLAVAISVVMAPMLPPMPSIDPLSVAAMVTALEQILLGFFLGLMLQILFTVMSLLGQILSLQMGLAMGIMNDPVNGQAVPLMGQLLIILGSFLFFIFDGHLVAIDVLVESFFTWPPGQSIFALDLYRVLALFGWMFGSALILAMPAVIAMLTVNMTFGVMNRSAPSLNIFALGFPLSMIMGLISLVLTIAGIPGRYSEFTTHVLNEMRLLVTLTTP